MHREQLSCRRDTPVALVVHLASGTTRVCREEKVTRHVLPERCDD